MLKILRQTADFVYMITRAEYSIEIAYMHENTPQHIAGVQQYKYFEKIKI